MPSGIVTPHYKPTTSAPHRSGLMLRARVWMKHLDLDAALASGVDPIQSEELVLRAKQLVEPKKRGELAAGITALIEIADRQRAAIVTTHLPFRPKQVQANRPLLLELAERLRSDRPVAMQGLALTSLLLEDGRRSLTTDSNPAELERAVRGALSALDVDARLRRDERPRLGSTA